MEEALFPEDLKDNYSVVYLQLIATAYEKGQKFFGTQGLNDERKRAKEFQEKALTLKYVRLTNCCKEEAKNYTYFFSFNYFVLSFLKTFLA